MRIIFLLLTLSIFSLIGVQAQKVSIQELESKINNNKVDSNLVNLLNQLGDVYYDEQNYTKALPYYQKAHNFAQKLNFKKGIIRSHSNLASTYRFQGQYLLSIQNHQQAIFWANNIKDEVQLCKSHINLGNVYRNTGEYPEALSNYLKGLGYAKKLQNLRLEAAALNNIGEIYRFQGNLKEAIKYYEEALAINKNLNNQVQIATNLNNIGALYLRTETPQKAENYFKESLEIAQQKNNKKLMMLNYTNLASIYTLQVSTTDKALTYAQKAIQLADEIQDNYNGSLTRRNLAKIYMNMQKNQDAEKLLLESKALAEKIGAKEELANVYYDLIVYEAKANNNMSQILAYEMKFQQLRDELQSEKIGDALAKLQNKFDFKEKIKENEILRKNNQLKELEAQESKLIALKQSQENEILNTKNELLSSENQLQKITLEKQKIIEREIQLKAEKEQQEKEILKKEARIQAEVLDKQRQLTFVFAIIGTLVVALALVLWRANIQRKTANDNLQAKNIEINQQNEEIVTQRDMLYEQKKLLEIERQNTLDSIHYAKNIQGALLPSQESLESYFDNVFIFYRPKHIVSGDFYYFSEQNGRGILALADCTGHGVPGAFMSSLGIALLNNLIVSEKITEPHIILERLNKDLIQALHQEVSGNQDGMDISICIIDKEKKEILFAAANNNAFLRIDGMFLELKADKLGIGGFLEKEKKFGVEKVSYQKECQIYLFSDGFQDQFGGEKNRKYSRKNFRELIEQTSLLPHKQQQKTIQREFEAWKAIEEQIDDVSVLKVSLHNFT
ncbi:MAG: tetratricopeptide repeat protein [Thermonemataceae bacterium]|nr:tetratricopeptide repeat protein [Thermonemataceae bacterium]